MKSSLEVYDVSMPLPPTDQELEVAEPDAAPARPGVRPLGAQNFPRRFAATHRSQMPVIVWLILSLIWGSTWLFIKLGLEDLPPFTFAGIRFVIAAAILLIIIVSTKRPLPKSWRDWALIAGTGFLSFTVNYG